MGPPAVQGAPALPKMGVRAFTSYWPHGKGVSESQPPQRYDSLVPRFPSGSPNSYTLLQKSLDLQTRPDSTYSVCQLLSPSPRKSLMKRSNSEVTISDIGDEDLDPAAINMNTGATLRREYGSTSTLHRQSSSDFTETLIVEQQPSAPAFPEHPHLSMSQSSLQTATQIAQGNFLYVPGHDCMDPTLLDFSDQERLHVQKNKPEKSQIGIFSRLKVQRRDRDHMQQQDVRSRQSLTSQKCFCHYDIQSILFSFSESITHQENLTSNVYTGALPGFRWQDAADPDLNVPPGFCSNLDDGDGKSSILVLSCPSFFNEIGGERERNLGLTRAIKTSNASVSVLENYRENQVSPQKLMNYNIEHLDLGAKYYLKYFYNRDHQNYFGIDENFGPVSVSIRREKLEDGVQYNYRIIVRTGQLPTLRGSILEDCVPSSSKHGTAGGLPFKDVLGFVVPALNIQSLRLATNSPRVPELLLQLDQQELIFQHKVGVLLCRASQTTEEQMYNNETGSPALDQFLDLLRHTYRLKGFTKFQGQLDAAGDSTGSHSVYTTFREFELMFHVSTLLPYTANDTQQLLRKCHIRSNSVTVIFQEPDSPPFSPTNVRSELQHVFIIVRVHHPCSQNTCYSVAVSRCRDVPVFGPFIEAGQMFPASSTFRDFLLTKVINAEHAVRKSKKFVAMVTCRRKEFLKEMVENFTTSVSIDSSSSIGFSFISLGGKKKKQSTPRPQAHMQSGGALTWSVTARDFNHSTDVTCRLAISNQLVVLIEEVTRQVVFNCYCRDVIGWHIGHRGIKLFYEHGNCVMFSTREGHWEDVREITQRLQMVTRGGAAMEMDLRRNRLGQLGFHVNFEGVVADVETHGFAWQAGLRSGCRLMEICGVAMVTMLYKQMMELLRTSATVNVVVVPPHRDGTPRRCFSENYPVPVIEYKLDSDITSHSFSVTPPTWHQVSAPPCPSVSSNQSEGSEAEQQLILSSYMKEGSRIPLASCPSSFGSSQCNTSTTTDPGPSVTQKTQAHYRAAPDWSVCSDDYRLEGPGKTSSTEAKWLLHRHHHHNHHHNNHHVKKVLRERQQSLTENKQQRSGGKSCSSGSSSSSSDDRHSEWHLTCVQGVSTDSGIDTTSGLWSGPSLGAEATLVLRDVWGKGPERGLTWGVTPTTSSGHATVLNDTCSLSSRSLARTMSDDSLYRTTLSPTSSLLMKPSYHHSTSFRRQPWVTLQRSELCYSDSSLTDRPKMTGGLMPLPQVSSHLNWSHLVETAGAFEGVFLSSSLSDVDQFHQEISQDATSQISGLQDSEVMSASLPGKVFQLEEILHQLQVDLLKEQQDKNELQLQVLSLRQDNHRLQEESRSAANQMRRVTSWILQRRLVL